MIDPYEYEMGLAVGYHLHVETCEDQTSAPRTCPCGRFIRAQDADDEMMHRLENAPIVMEPSMIEFEIKRKAAQEKANEIIKSRRAAQEPKLTLTRASERMSRPSISWLVDGLVPHGPTVGIMYGKQGSCKTFAALDLCLAVSNRRETWMGKTISPCHLTTGELVAGEDIVYVLGEGTVGFPDRERAWMEAFGGTTDNLYTIEMQETSLVTEMGMHRLCESVDLAGLKPAVIVYDTQGLTAGLGADENSRTEMRAVFARAKSLAAKYNCLVLMLSHPGANPQALDRPAGATTQAQDADLVLFVTWSDKEKRGKIKVNKVKEGRANYTWTYTRRTIGNALVLDYSGELSQREEEAEAAADAFPGCPYPAKLAEVLEYLETAPHEIEERNVNTIHTVVGGDKSRLIETLKYAVDEKILGYASGSRGMKGYWKQEPIAEEEESEE